MNKKKAKDKRIKRLPVMLTSEEMKRVREEAKVLKLTISKYVRMMLGLTGFGEAEKFWRNLVL